MTKILQHPADFDNAMFFVKKIEVWQDGEIIDYGGVIQKHNDEVVYINDACYFKGFCEFKIR